MTAKSYAGCGRRNNRVGRNRSCWPQFHLDFESAHQLRKKVIQKRPDRAANKPKYAAEKWQENGNDHTYNSREWRVLLPCHRSKQPDEQEEGREEQTHEAYSTPIILATDITPNDLTMCIGRSLL
jgi:hypothetical protein